MSDPGHQSFSKSTVQTAKLTTPRGHEIHQAPTSLQSPARACSVAACMVQRSCTLVQTKPLGSPIELNSCLLDAKKNMSSESSIHRFFGTLRYNPFQRRSYLRWSCEEFYCGRGKLTDWQRNNKASRNDLAGQQAVLPELRTHRPTVSPQHRIHNRILFLHISLECSQASMPATGQQRGTQSKSLHFDMWALVEIPYCSALWARVSSIVECDPHI